MRLSLVLALAAVCSLAFAPAPFPRARKSASAQDIPSQLEGIWKVESCSVGGRVQGGPGPLWDSVRVERGTWSQSTRSNGRVLWTTAYRIRLGPHDASRIDMAYPGATAPLLYGVLRLDGDRLVVTHATSGPRPTSHTAQLRSGQVRWVLRRARP